MPTVIKVEDLSKRYIIRHEAAARYRTLRDAIAERFGRWAAALRHPFRGGAGGTNPTREEFWALDGVTFNVAQGDRIGIIGRNGAGKTTLLKIISRITEPTRGRISMRGRVASLLEVGTGFHPELTGRENIFLNGAVLGMTRREIRAKFDEIVAFAEVEKFLDTPVKRYSSGMYVRLAFAVAAHLEPEILLVDEVLAVGDTQFQKKCLGKMEDVSTKEGRTVLFVSHNMGAVSKLCNRAILLNQGKMVVDSAVAPVLDAYMKITSREGGHLDFSLRPHLPCSILKVRVVNKDGVETTTFDINDEIVIVIVYQVTSPLQGLQLTVTLARNMTDLFHSFDTDGLDEIPARQPGLYEARYRIPKMFLKAGSYCVRLTSGLPRWLLQDFEGALQFDVEEMSENTRMKGYSRERLGHIISPGVWETARL